MISLTRTTFLLAQAALVAWLMLVAAVVDARKERTKIMLLVKDGDPSDGPQRRAMIAAVASYLEDLEVFLGVTVVHALPSGDGETLQHSAERKAEELGVSALFWCSDRTDSRVRLNLYVALEDGELLIQRELNHQSAEAFAEKTAIILKSALTLARSQPDARRDRSADQAESSADANPLDDYLRTRPPLSTRTEQAVASQSLAPVHHPFSFHMAYRLGIATTETAPTPGLSLAAFLRTTDLLSLFVGYTISSQNELERHGVRFTTTRHSVYLGLEIATTLGSWTLGGSLALGLDRVGWDAKAVSSELQSNGGGSEFQLSVGPCVGGAYRFLRWVRVFASAGVEFFPVRPRFTVSTTDGKLSAYETWFAQPLILVGLAFEVI